MNKYDYRGRDRRLIQQTLRNLIAIQERDVKSINPKYTTQISTRLPIFVGTITSGPPNYNILSPTPGSPAAMSASLQIILESELEPNY
jgi:hypothetical protein